MKSSDRNHKKSFNEMDHNRYGQKQCNSDQVNQGEFHGSRSLRKTTWFF